MLDSAPIQGDRREALRAVYGAAHRAVAAASVAGTLVLGAIVYWLAAESLPLVLAISIGSAAVAHLALVPGSVIVRRGQPGTAAGEGARGGEDVEAEESLAPAENDTDGHHDAGVDYDPMVAWLAGTLVRLLGTVALVGWCRYQMAESDRNGLLLGTVLGWYVVLTAIEVGVLARGLPRLDRRGD